MVILVIIQFLNRCFKYKSMDNNYDFTKLLKWFALLDRQLKNSKKEYQNELINEMLRSAGIEEIEY